MDNEMPAGAFLVPILGALALVFLLAWHISDPWQYLHDDNGAWYSSIARSHLHPGLQATRGQDFFTRRDTGELIPYLHHPPLAGLYLALVFEVTGTDSALTARLATALVHLGSFALFVMIARRMFPRLLLMQAWAIATFALVPMSSLFGKMPNHEPLGLFFILACFWAYLQYLGKTSGARYLWLLIGTAGCILGCWTAWHAALVMVAFGLVTFIAYPREGRWYSATVVVAACLSLIAVCAHLLWANQWQSIPSQAESVGIWMRDTGHSFLLSLWSSLGETFRHGRRFFGPIPWLLTFWWVGLWIWKRKWHLKDPKDVFVLAMSAGTIFYWMLFHHAIDVHAYQLFNLLPFVAIASALGMRDICVRLEVKHKKWQTTVFLVASCGMLFSSALVLREIYRKPNDWAVKASRDIQQQFL